MSDLTTNLGLKQPAVEGERLLLNLLLRDNNLIIDAAAAPASARVYNSAALPITNNTDTALTFNSERWDTDAFHATSSNTSRMTIPTGKAGLYLITCTVEFASNATGFRKLFFYVNGSVAVANVQVDAVGSGATILTLTTQYRLAEGDYVEAFVAQTSGGSLNVSASGNQSPEFSIARLGGY